MALNYALKCHFPSESLLSWDRGILGQIRRLGPHPTFPPLNFLIRRMTRRIFVFKYLWNGVTTPLTVMDVLEGQMSANRLLFCSKPRQLSQHTLLRADLRLPAAAAESKESGQEVHLHNLTHIFLKKYRAIFNS